MKAWQLSEKAWMLVGIHVSHTPSARMKRLWPLGSHGQLLQLISRQANLLRRSRRTLESVHVNRL